MKTLLFVIISFISFYTFSQKYPKKFSASIVDLQQTDLSKNLTSDVKKFINKIDSISNLDIKLLKDFSKKHSVLTIFIGDSIGFIDYPNEKSPVSMESYGDEIITVHLLYVPKNISYEENKMEMLKLITSTFLDLDKTLQYSGNENDLIEYITNYY
jgi:hypothetical protein